MALGGPAPMALRHCSGPPARPFDLRQSGSSARESHRYSAIRGYRRRVRDVICGRFGQRAARSPVPTGGIGGCTGRAARAGAFRRTPGLWRGRCGSPRKGTGPRPHGCSGPVAPPSDEDTASSWHGASIERRSGPVSGSGLSFSPLAPLLRTYTIEAAGDDAMMGGWFRRAGWRPISPYPARAGFRNRGGQAIPGGGNSVFRRIRCARPG